MDIKTIIENDYNNLDAPIKAFLDELFHGSDYAQFCCSTRMKQAGMFDFDNTYILAVTRTDIIEIKPVYELISSKTLFLNQIVSLELPSSDLKSLPKLIIRSCNGIEIEHTFENREVLHEFVYRLRCNINRATQ